MSSDRHLREAFGSAEPEHFKWQTSSLVVGDKERELVAAAFLPLGARVLDLGCAEGGTLEHLGDLPFAVGIDLFLDKLRFARAHMPTARFVVGSGIQLPFATGCFDHVIVRDVIHHVPEPTTLVEECRRVLTSGGRIDVLEPCRYNPLIFMHAVARAAERGELRSTRAYLEGLLTRCFEVKRVERYQPLPLHRLVFHPEVGNPRWATVGWVRGLVECLERLAGVVLPRAAWAYLHLRGEVR